MKMDPAVNNRSMYQIISCCGESCSCLGSDHRMLKKSAAADKGAMTL